MTFRSRTPELGEAHESIDVISGAGDMSIGFDARFVMNAISSIGTANIRLELKDAMSAAVIKPIEGDDHLCLVMPMRLDT